MFAREYKPSNKKLKHMNKNIALLTLSLLLGAGFVTGCGNDEDDSQQPIEETETSKQLPAGTFVGWTEGSNPYAGYIPSANDSIVITRGQNGFYELSYLSATHGRGVIKNVQVTKNDTAFILQKPVTATINAEGTDFVFSQTPDTIAMPNRNPEGGTGSWKAYPATFDGGYLTVDGKRWELTLRVFCNVRYIHKCIVREGAIGNRKSEQ